MKSKKKNESNRLNAKAKYNAELHAELINKAISSVDRRGRTPSEHFCEEVKEFDQACTLEESIAEAGDVLFTMIKLIAHRTGETDAGALLGKILSKNLEKLGRHSARQDDVLGDLAHYVAAHGGWMEVSVVLEEGVLFVDCDGDRLSYRLVYDVKNRREIHGRLRSLWITLPMLEAIHSLV